MLCVLCILLVNGRLMSFFGCWMLLGLILRLILFLCVCELCGIVLTMAFISRCDRGGVLWEWIYGYFYRASKLFFRPYISTK